MIRWRSALMAAWSATRTLLSTLRILCAQQRWTGMSGKAVGSAASRPEPPSTHSISRRSPVNPRRLRSPRNCSHCAALSALASRKSMTSFLPSGRRPSATSTGRASAPGVGPHHLERAEGPRARHRQLDVAELGEQVTAIAAVAAISLAQLGHALEVVVDQLVHPAAQQLRDRVPGALAIVRAPFDPFGLHGLHHPERGW